MKNSCPLKGTVKIKKMEENICSRYMTKDLYSENIKKFTTQL